MPTMNTIEHTNRDDGRVEGLRYVIQPVPNIHVNSVRHRDEVLRYGPDINKSADAPAAAYGPRPHNPLNPMVLRTP